MRINIDPLVVNRETLMKHNLQLFFKGCVYQR